MIGLSHLRNEESQASLLRIGRRILNKAPTFLPYIFAILLATALPSLLWSQVLDFLPHSQVQDGGKIIVKKRGSSIAILVKNSPFGLPPPSRSGAESSSTIVRSTLSLTLFGIALTHHRRDSLALIGMANGVEHVYRPGDILPAGARLVAVRRNRVFIRYQGSLQTIVFHHHALSSGVTSEAPGFSGVPKAPVPSPASHLRSHPPSLLNYFRPIPVYNNGRFAGVRLYPGHDVTLFKRFGLHSGDILTAVNGVTLTNPLQGYNLIQRFAARRVPIILNIQRNGTTLVISIPTNSTF